MKKTKPITKSKKHSKSKKQNKSKKSKQSKQLQEDLSLEDSSLLDYKTKKSFSSVTSLSNYKSKTHIGEIYDYKPLHDKINNICITNMLKKKPSLNKKISKELCECIFDKNKDLSINDLEKNIESKTYIPSIDCITIYDKFNKKNMKNIKSKSNSKSLSIN